MFATLLPAQLYSGDSGAEEHPSGAAPPQTSGPASPAPHAGPPGTWVTACLSGFGQIHSAVSPRLLKGNSSGHIGTAFVQENKTHLFAPGGCGTVLCFLTSVKTVVCGALATSSHGWGREPPGLRCAARSDPGWAHWPHPWTRMDRPAPHQTWQHENYVPASDPGT